MLNNYKNRKQEGFTIIEVLIVLAIAGLILLVVFLAVPALQRNARNTSLKSDVQNVLGGVSEFQSNNNGKFPDNITGTGDITISSGTGTSAISQTTKVSGQTKVSKVTAAPGTGTGTTAVAGVPAGEIQVLLGKTCAGTTSARAIAVYYVNETSGGNTQTCQDS